MDKVSICKGKGYAELQEALQRFIPFLKNVKPGEEVEFYFSINLPEKIEETSQEKHTL